MIRARLRGRLYDGIKRYRQGRVVVTVVRDLGCSMAEFIAYLESRFLPGMTWENYGNGHQGWSIDHVIPLAWFDLRDKKAARYATHFSNLQPVWRTKIKTDWGK